MAKDRKDIRTVLVKFGVAVAISVFGFLYSNKRTRRISKNKRTRRTNASRPPFSLGQDNEVNVGEMPSWPGDDPCISKKTSNSTNAKYRSADKFEDTYTIEVAIDNSEVFPSPSSRHGGDKDVYLLPEFNDLVKEFGFTTIHSRISSEKDVVDPRSDMETPKSFTTAEKDDYDHEIRHLNDIIVILQERVRNLKVQLLESYGKREQNLAIMELKNQLNLKNMEVKFFILKIDSLRADKQMLQEQIDDSANIITDLEAAESKIEFLEKKLRSEAEWNKEQILTVQKRVSKLQEALNSASHKNIQLYLQKLKSLEAEAEELRKSNSNLHLENTELAFKLESSQILANSVPEDPEMEALRELCYHLRHENEYLANKIDQLQADRCSDAEDLVYLRWVNACLRYELRNFLPPQGKTIARDLSRSLSPESGKKAKRLILEYARAEGLVEKGINITDFESDRWSSSQTSCITYSGELDEFSASSNSQNSHDKKFFNNFSRLLQGKDNHHGSIAQVDAESTHEGSSISTGNDFLYGLPANTFQNLSLLSGYSSRHSMDFERLQTQNSDVGSYLHRRLSFFERGGDASQYHIDHRKSELMKFAQVLKESSSLPEETRSLGKCKRKSESFG